MLMFRFMSLSARQGNRRDTNKDKPENNASAFSHESPNFFYKKKDGNRSPKCTSLHLIFFWYRECTVFDTDSSICRYAGNNSYDNVGVNDKSFMI